MFLGRWKFPSVLVRRSVSSTVAANRGVDQLGLLGSYKARVAGGTLQFDENQYSALKHLNKMNILLGRMSASTAGTNTVAEGDKNNERRLKGLYLYGNVGTGKTMIMDEFFQHVGNINKRRVHFNEFMLEVHRRIHGHKKQLLQQFGRDIHLNLSSERDSILIIAREIAQEARVLCFDEFQVTDICDAMILSRLFGELWRQGVVLVATSNRHPEQLYLNGLNRQYFLPFIVSLQTNCVVRDIGVDKDYRQDNQRADGAYFMPNSQETREKLWAQYAAQLAGQPSQEETVPVMMGRSLTLPAANLARGACFVSFAELCETDRGSADYQALCAHFRTVYMHGIPALTVLVHNEARRLIMLVDAMYNSGTRFVWTAAAPPAEIFRVLTAAEMPQEKDAALGTDHAWSAPAHIASSVELSSGEAQQEEGRHLRGGQQSEVKIPLDSNLYFGTTVKFAQSEQVRDIAGQGGTGVEQSAPADAAQDELKVLEGELASVQELGFAFRRASSRLVEMSSVAYLQKWECAHLDSIR